MVETDRLSALRESENEGNIKPLKLKQQNLLPVSILSFCLVLLTKHLTGQVIEGYLPFLVYFYS